MMSVCSSYTGHWCLIDNVSESESEEGKARPQTNGPQCNLWTWDTED